MWKQILDLYTDIPVMVMELLCTYNSENATASKIKRQIKLIWDLSPSSSTERIGSVLPAGAIWRTVKRDEALIMWLIKTALKMEFICELYPGELTGATCEKLRV